jgi:2-dehydropantoate 2-reductase
MKILVVGAGALGGYYGARLLAAGRDVTFLVRPPRAERLRPSCLSVTSPAGNLHLDAPPTVTAAALNGIYDLVILSCKSWDLEGAIADFAPAMGAGTRVLPLLNGLSHLELLDARLGAVRVLGGVARISCALDDAGRIHHVGKFQALVFGARSDGDAVRVEELGKALTVAGFDTHSSPHIMSDMWDKWVFIASAASLTGSMRATVGDVMAADGRHIAAGLLEESAAIAAANGFAPGRQAMELGLSVLTASGSPFTASMLRDIESGNRIEADHIVANLLQRKPAHLATPLLGMALVHLKAYEARRARLAAR